MKENGKLFLVFVLLFIFGKKNNYSFPFSYVIAAR